MIPNPNPIIIPEIPATPEKTFTHFWILSMTIQATHDDQRDNIYVQLCPYNPDTKERYTELTEEMVLPLWSSVNPDYCPEASAAMEAILSAVLALRVKSIPLPTQTPEE
jgi:hypothetical protein